MTEKIYQGPDFEDKVRKQVEFYFSDSNLQTDRFLWKIYEANDGWVELKTILTFGRMRQYRPEDKVIAALRGSDKLVLSKNEDMICRKEPVKDFNEIRNRRKRNSVRIEGFPHESTQEELEDFFEKKIAPNLNHDKEILSVRLIKTKAKKEFLGTIEVEFKDQKDADDFLNNMKIVYPQGVVKDDEEVNEKDLLKKMSVLTYQEMKEGRKRFGVNDVTKRKNNFGEPRNNKRKNSKGSADEISAQPSEGDKTEVLSEASSETKKAGSPKSTKTEEKSSEAPSDGKD